MKPFARIISSISPLDTRFEILSKAIEFFGLPVEVVRSSVRAISGPLEGVWTISSHLDTLEVKVLFGSDELIDATTEGLMRVHEALPRTRRRVRENTLETAMAKLKCSLDRRDSRLENSWWCYAQVQGGCQHWPKKFHTF